MGLCALAAIIGFLVSVAHADEPQADPSWLHVLDLRVSGYIQVQDVSSQISEDELTADGDPRNQDRFSVRRGRLKLFRDFGYGHAALEIDANTVHGPTVSVRRAEAAVRLPNADAARPPYAQLTLGLTDIPFGYELPSGNRDRVFMERTQGSRALFIGDADVGATLLGGLGPFRYAIAAQNGVPISDSPSADSSVYTSEKTLLGRLGFDAFAAQDDARAALSGGVSLLSGTGFHAGSAATKSSLAWTDKNQDGLVSLSELSALNGQAATASAIFSRWAVNADLEGGFRSALGWTRLFAEATMATNLDRGLYAADPLSTGYDLRELAWTAGLLQEITPYGIVGFRADSYDGDSDLFESRLGTFLPLDATVLTLSPVVGVQIQHRAKLLFQYDYLVDFLGRDVTGEPVDLANDLWTVRAQVEF